MDVVSMCALGVLGFVWQPRRGTYAQAVVVKATFRLEPGEAVLAEEQDAPNEEEQHWNDDGARSLSAVSDKVPYKPKADVMLVGHAYAPGQQPVRSLLTRLVVGELDKSIEVWCDRGFRLHEGQLLEGRRFTKMPLRWERAAGGPETNNPAGLRFDAPPDGYGMVAIPNLQPPGMFVSRLSDTFAPVCFAPIAAGWPPRMQRLGPWARAFVQAGWEERPLPDGFDYRYFQAAPLDQQVGEIRANERIILENLHPVQARLVTSLPGLRPRAVVDRATGEREEVALVADTLLIDTDRGVCSVVWRGSVGLRHAQEAGRVAVWVDGEPALAAGGAGERSGEELVASTMALMAPAAGVAPVLPFVPAESRVADPVTWATAAAEVAAKFAAFERSDGTGTVLALGGGGGDTLPFRGSVGGTRDTDEKDDVADTLVPLPKAHKATPPPSPVWLGLGVSSTEEPVLGPLPAVREEPRAGEEPKSDVEPAPPPMIGPLATPEMVQARESPEAEAGEVESEREQAEAPAEEVEPAEPESLPLEQYPLERCAAIAASIERRKWDRERILKDEKLAVEVWEALHAHWLAAIEAEVDRGRKKMLMAYDEAYVGRLEKERGPITAGEYAGLLMAAERRGAEAELKKLGLPEGAMMRIRRVWLLRSMKDQKAGAEVRAALRAAGEG